MKKPTILIVDDNEDNLELLGDALAEDAFRVVRARCGPDAMSLLMSQHVDLMLLDINMPEMNGFAVLEMVRFIPRLMNIPVIIQTAHDEPNNLERAKDLGVKLVLKKPIWPHKLAEEVRGCLAACELPVGATQPAGGSGENACH